MTEDVDSSVISVIQNGRQVRAKKKININNYFRKLCNFSVFVTVYLDFVGNRSLETDARVFL